MRITSIVKNAKTVDNLASKYWILHELISTLGKFISHTINKQTYLAHCMINDFIIFLSIIMHSYGYFVYHNILFGYLAIWLLCKVLYQE